LYSSPNCIRLLRWAGHVTFGGDVRNSYKILVGKPQGKRPCGILKHALKDNFEMDLRETGFEEADRIQVTQKTV